MTKQRVLLRFPPDAASKPLTYHLIKDFNLKVNILRAAITEGKEGRLVMEVEAEEESHLESGLDFLKAEGVDIKELSQQVTVNQEECIHCGSCTAVCFSGALRLDRQTWKLLFSPEKCVACGLCVNACPLRLISTVF